MGAKATPPSHRSSRAWSGAARESGLRLSPDTAVDTVVWPWLWEGPPGNAMQDLLGCRAVLGTSLAPEHRAPVVLFLAFCGGFWSRVGRTCGLGTRSPFCLRILAQLCPDRRQRAASAASQLVGERAAAGGGKQGSPGALGRLNQSFSRAAVPSTLHSAHPGAQPPGTEGQVPQVDRPSLDGGTSG